MRSKYFHTVILFIILVLLLIASIGGIIIYNRFFDKNLIPNSINETDINQVLIVLQSKNADQSSYTDSTFELVDKQKVQQIITTLQSFQLNKTKLPMDADSRLIFVFYFSDSEIPSIRVYIDSNGICGSSSLDPGNYFIKDDFDFSSLVSLI